MSALIAGIDFSSRALHAALIPLDPDDGSDAPPVTLRSFEMPTWKGETTPAFRKVERCRVVHAAMLELLCDVVGPMPPPVRSDYGTTWGPSPRWEVVHVCIEEPFGSKSRSTVLWEILGAILASIPSHIERDTILTNEWRRIIWPPFPVQASPDAEPQMMVLDVDKKRLAIAQANMETGLDLDEHQAESYLIARACRARLDKAFAA